MLSGVTVLLKLILTLYLLLYHIKTFDSQATNLQFFSYGINDMQTTNVGDCCKPQAIFGIRGNRLYGGIIDQVVKFVVMTHLQYVQDIQISNNYTVPIVILYN